MPNVAVDGTTIKHESGEDGKVIASQTNLFAEGKAVARVGDKCTIHSDGVVEPNSSTVMNGGIQIARVGDTTSCDPPGVLDMEGAAATVFADGGGGV